MLWVKQQFGSDLEALSFKGFTVPLGLYINDEGDEPQGLVDGTRTLIFDLNDDRPVSAAGTVS